MKTPTTISDLKHLLKNGQELRNGGTDGKESVITKRLGQSPSLNYFWIVEQMQLSGFTTLISSAFTALLPVEVGRRNPNELLISVPLSLYLIKSSQSN